MRRVFRFARAILSCPGSQPPFFVPRSDLERDKQGGAQRSDGSLNNNYDLNDIYELSSSWFGRLGSLSRSL
jgi:hypothetical protein